MTVQYHLMQQALRLAAQGLGQVWPNPAVGCVIAKEGQVVGMGRTQRGGRPHAETQAIAMASGAARGATAYVTLEPCAHYGQTPPCTEALISAGVAKVVIACTDPDPRVQGKGIHQLEAAGIQVVSGVCEAEARELNKGFFSRIQRNRPWVTLKTATSADGYIADAEGKSKWITGEQARSHGHGLRSRNDAILTGIATVLADDPSLDCRLPGMEACSPVRIVLDRQGRMPASARMLQDGGAQVWVLSVSDPLEALLSSLAQRGITRLLVEAGSRLSSAFMQARLVDEVYWYRAPILFGSGLKAFDFSLPLRLVKQEERMLGKDCLTVYRLNHSKG